MNSHYYNVPVQRKVDILGCLQANRAIANSSKLALDSQSEFKFQTSVIYCLYHITTQMTSEYNAPKMSNHHKHALNCWGFTCQRHDMRHTIVDGSRKFCL